jgi:cation:H+ antiporter
MDLAFLGGASLYSVVIPLTRRLAWYDAIVLLSLFVAYLWCAARGERSEPHLVGVARQIGDLPKRTRRMVIFALLASAAVIVLASAERFAGGLISGGKQLGLDEFLLVQWIAPLASEAPELLVAGVLALRGHQDSALGTLLSSKVNQWTLLVGSLPIAFMVGGGAATGMVLDARQTEEFILTAAQTLLGFAVLLDLRLAVWESVALLVLFAAQLPFPQTTVRLAFSGAYVAVALVLILRRRNEVRALVRSPGALLRDRGIREPAGPGATGSARANSDPTNRFAAGR